MHRAPNRRLAAATTVVALALAAALAPVALGQGPAVDQYNPALPSATPNGGGHGGGGGAAPSGGSSGSSASATPPATSTPTDSSSAAAGSGSTPTYGSQGSGGSGHGNSSSHGSGSGHAGAQDSTPGTVQAIPVTHHTNSAPAVAADVAGEGGVPMLLAGLAAITAIAIFVFYRQRRVRA
jgi:hypothetical protein